MKNKIFLTSMLAMFVACPGVAATAENGDFDGDGYNEGFISPGAGATNCNTPPLMHDDQTPSTGTFTLTADWEPDQCTIQLDYNPDNGGASASIPAQLWTTYGVGAYRDSSRTQLMKPWVNNNNAGQNGLNSAPVGQTVYANWEPIKVINPVTNMVYSMSPVSQTSGERSFGGFYQGKDPNNAGARYIYPSTYSRKLTQDGDTVAKAIAKDDITGKCPTTIWYAQWGCADINIPKQPTLTGYTFDHWYESISATGEPISSDLCIYNDATYYGKFNPNRYTVTYVCENGYTMSLPNGRVGTTPTSGGIGSVININTDVHEHGENSSETVVYDTPYTWWDPVTSCVFENHTCKSWKCTDKNGRPVELTEGYWQIDSDVVCISMCDTNTVYLHWEAEQTDGFDDDYYNNYCEYGSGLAVAPKPIRHGYTFTGWIVTDWTEDTPSGN